MDIKTAKLRVKAKKFKASIPIGLAIKVPEELWNSIEDRDVRTFKDLLEEIGLRQQGGGYWERDYERRW